ncbi:MAG: exonuclease domain-containing protein [Desulfovibrionaceae bacterium]|nr:exonuclease domain-containing protein [Desulfovibrionaceae bacterium]
MTLLTEGRCGVAIDFETSHYGPENACAVGMAKIRNGEVADVFYRLIRPPSPVVLFSDIHGLTWPMLRDQPTFAEVWPDMASFCVDADFFVAHNASFDRRVLRACCRAAGVAMPSAPFCCTLKGARRHLPLASRRLNDVCAYYGIPLRHHDAASDALAAARIFLRLCADYGLGPHDLRLK